jgi:hypothetical protein
MAPPRWRPLRRKRSLVLAQVRDLPRRAVVVGTLVVMSLLGLAAPANAQTWHTVGSFTPKQFCLDLGVERVRAQGSGTYRCLADPQKRNYWILQVTLPRGPRPQ